MANIFTLQKDKSSTGTAGERGTGLGLYIVKELVEQNNGKIAISSKMGNGTAIKLIFKNE